MRTAFCKKTTGFLLLFWGSLSFATPTLAQTGSLSGVVVDAETGETLIGANVVLEGTATGSTTDLDGRYRIQGLAQGTYSVVFSYIGYTPKTVRNVAVAVGENTQLDLSLSTRAVGLDEIVVEVEAVRNAEAALLRERQKAAAVSDAISAEAIGRSGSSTAADAMKKVTGATVVGGKYVNVRGLEGRYVNTQLNGAELPSADPDRNAVPFDLFPSDLLDHIITTKTFTPDQPGSFTGGSINIGTKSFPERRTLSLSSSVSYTTEIGLGGDVLRAGSGLKEIPAVLESGGVPSFTSALSDRAEALRLDAVTRAFRAEMEPVTEAAPIDQSYALSYGDQFSVFGGRPLGLVASLSYSTGISGHGDGALGQYELTGDFDGTDLLATNFRYNEVSGAQEELLGGLANLTFRPHPKHEVGLNLLYNRSDEHLARFQFGSLPRDLSIGEVFESRVLQQIDRSLATVQGRGEHVFGQGQGLRLTWNATYTEAAQDEPDLRIFSSHVDTTGPLPSYFIAPSLYPKPTRYFRDLSEWGWSNDLAAALPAWSATVKVGGSLFLKERTFRERRFQYERTTGYEGNPDLFFGEAVGLLEGTLESGPPYSFGNYIQEVTQASNNYDADQTVAAGFGMVDVPALFARNLRFIGGVRAEYTDQSVLNTERQGEIQGLDLLPSAGFVYGLGGHMNARLAYSRTLARPSFREFAPFNAYDFVSAVQVIGNPDLDRTLVHNFDARWEWFLRPGEILAASAFYKDFTNPIEQVLSPGAVNREITYENAAAATVAGLEFEVRKRLDFMASPLRYLQVGGNLALTRSEVAIDARELARIRSKVPDAAATRPLQGQSPYVLNLDLGYINPEEGTSVALYYNVFGERLYTVARSGTPNLYEQPRRTLDVVASQQLPFHVEVKLSVKNLLDEAYVISQGFKDQTYINHRYDLGRTISLGLKYRL